MFAQSFESTVANATLAWYSIRPLAQANLVRLDGVVLVVEQAELDRRGALREDGEIHTLAVPYCAEGVRLAGPYTHCVCRCRIEKVGTRAAGAKMERSGRLFGGRRGGRVNT